MAGPCSTSKEQGVSGYICAPIVMKKCHAVPQESPLNIFSIQIVSEQEPWISDLDEVSELAHNPP